MPEPGQGALAVEVRSDREDLLELLAEIQDRDTCIAVASERAFVEGMGGGCRVPIAAHAAVDGDIVGMVGLVSSVDGGEMIKTRIVLEAGERGEAGPCAGQGAVRDGRRRDPGVRGCGMSEAGVVYLVGAGPGDPGLITARGLALLRSANVVVYDRLVNRRLLEEAPTDAELVDAGKARGDRRMSQDDMNRLLVDRARDGLRVVRLKGGDPFVFGRGGEEAEWLAETGIRFEVVPGVTSAIAAAGLRGHPLNASPGCVAGYIRQRFRGPGQARVRRRLGVACPNRRHAGSDDGVGDAPRDSGSPAQQRHGRLDARGAHRVGYGAASAHRDRQSGGHRGMR